MVTCFFEKLYFIELCVIENYLYDTCRATNANYTIAIILSSQWIPRYWTGTGSSRRRFFRIGGVFGKTRLARYVGRRSGREERHIAVEQLREISRERHSLGEDAAIYSRRRSGN